MIFVGILLRILVFFASSPGNSYDNHIEVIQLYSEGFDRPAPFSLWQSYQPPVYYYIAAVVNRIAGLSDYFNVYSWHLVQSINVLLSVLLLVVVNRILIAGHVTVSDRVFALSLISVFPRDIFTAVMIGNDYLLLFMSVIAFGLYLSIMGEKFTHDNRLLFLKTVCLYVVVLVASLTKQHGFILFLLPLAISGKHFLENGISTFRRHLISLCLVFCLASVDEVWKYSQTGHIFVSNQDHFDYADQQFPRELSAVEFTTFRLLSLLEHPYLSDHTSASIPTEIFARMFFDYEWRFSDPSNILFLIISRIIYAYGFILLFYMAFCFVSHVWKKGLFSIKNMKDNLLPLMILIVCLCYLLVPFVQTIRFPHFSSMKAVFALPGIYGLIILQAIWREKDTRFSPIRYAFTVLNLIIGIIYLGGVAILYGSGSSSLSGPIWPLP